MLLSGSRIFVTGILLAGAVLLSRCGAEGEKKKDEAVAADSASCSKPLNPNGDSELALLMRQMLHSSQSMRELVLKGNLPDRFPEEFLKIHTAKPTDAETKKPSFEGHASNYIFNLQELYKSGEKDLTKNYNAMINSCVSCHQEHCPGPLKTIEKLKI